MREKVGTMQFRVQGEKINKKGENKKRRKKGKHNIYIYV
jgi:hypothetical protein